MFESINLMAVLVAGVVMFLFGWLYHGPLFGKLWLKLSNVSEEEARKAKEKGMKGMAGVMLIALIKTVITALGVAWVISLAGAPALVGLIAVVFWTWLLFVGTTTLDQVLWEKKILPLWILNNVYNLLSLVIAALIIGLWTW